MGLWDEISLRCVGFWEMLDFLLGGILTGSTMQRQKESMLNKHLVQTQRELVLTEILPLTVAIPDLCSLLHPAQFSEKGFCLTCPF